MQNLREYIEEKEEKNCQINESIPTVIGNVLGYSVVGMVAAFGGTLIVLGGSKLIKLLKRFWMNIKNTWRQIIGKEEIKEIKKDRKVQAEIKKIEDKKDKFVNELGPIYAAIRDKDWERAKAAFSAIDPSLHDNPDVVKVIITEITKAIDEPPLHYGTTGNDTYKAIKKIINIKVARAAAAATKIAYDKKLKLGEE
jgi:hypothetical protein